MITWHYAKFCNMIVPQNYSQIGLQAAISYIYLWFRMIKPIYKQNWLDMVTVKLKFAFSFMFCKVYEWDFSELKQYFYMLWKQILRQSW